MSPMLRQYHALKQDHADSILLFRMGDFYEMFYDDAKTASRLLELTLTARGKGTDNVVPMCGFPHHQLDSYTARLVKANQTVAICDQVEDPKQAKGLVRREVVKRVTPGTLNDPAELDAKANQWIAALAASQGRFGLALLDVTTGAFLVWETDARAPGADGALADRVRQFGPREVVHPEGWEPPPLVRDALPAGTLLHPIEPYGFTLETAREGLQQHFSIASLDGFGLRGDTASIAAAGGLLGYLQDNQRCGWEHIDRIARFEPEQFLRLDASTVRNLELFRSIRDGGRAGSLFDTLDDTVTAPGARRLAQWLGAPLLDIASVESRHSAVGELLQRGDVRRSVRETLRGVHDVERLLSKAVSGSAGPRDLMALRGSLQRLPDLCAALESTAAALLRQTIDGLDRCEDLLQLLERGIVDEPPALLRDGGVIREGFNAELDELRAIQRDGKSTIAAIEAREREATKIGSLKVRFNKVFGYFIEVSKANLHLVPQHYHRKQTIANGERFITDELKQYESKILTAQERIESLEQEEFQRLRRAVAGEAPRLKAIADATATIDVLASFASRADAGGYVRPTIVDGRELRIVGGRHPVVERHLPVGQRFVPNDSQLDGDQRSIAVLTGPNMGGKSTYLRQVALMVLLAQTGSFVPAEEATVGIADRIFCRVGASDSLAEGQSTFMVEMTETANILHQATSRSVVLLDEIGRGTATFDGLSIAWAVVERLHGQQGGAPRTLFATHYHELTELAVELTAVFNLRMAVKEWGEQVRFLHRVEEGAADRSYGIQVARLAGVPDPVVRRADEILTNLQRDAYGGDGRPRRGRGAAATAERRQPALAGLFEEPGVAGAAATEPDPAVSELLAEIRACDPNRLTPLEALNRLAEWTRRLDREG